MGGGGGICGCLLLGGFGVVVWYCAQTASLVGTQSGQASGQSKPLFKMKKFASVGPRVSSHRHAQLPQHHSSEAEANHLALEEEQGWANTSGTDYGSP